METTSKTIKITNLATDEELTNPKLYGWICPICGRGNSPFTTTCMCRPLNTQVTCGPGKYIYTLNTTGGTIHEAR